MQNTITASSALNPVGTVVLVVVDIQGGGVDEPDLEFMPGVDERDSKAVALVGAFRAAGVPVVFIQEMHKPSLIDIGRELDGSEGPHAIEGDPKTELHPGLDPRPDEYLVRKRRYSAFFGTDLDIVLRGYGADTVVLIGGMTDVCIHYTAADAHQLDYRFRTVEEIVAGSSTEAHRSALRHMQYLQRDGVVSEAAVYDWLATLD